MQYVLYAIHIVFISVCMEHMNNLQQYYSCILLQLYLL